MTSRDRDDDLLSVMRSPAGRRFVWRILTQSGVWSPSFAAEPLSTAFNEGRRNVGLALLRELQRVTPQEYIMAFNEAASAEELERLEAPTEE